MKAGREDEELEANSIVEPIHRRSVDHGSPMNTAPGMPPSSVTNFME